MAKGRRRLRELIRGWYRKQVFSLRGRLQMNLLLITPALSLLRRRAQRLLKEIMSLLQIRYPCRWLTYNRDKTNDDWIFFYRVIITIIFTCISWKSFPRRDDSITLYNIMWNRLLRCQHWRTHFTSFFRLGSATSWSLILPIIIRQFFCLVLWKETQFTWVFEDNVCTLSVINEVAFYLKCADYRCLHQPGLRPLIWIRSTETSESLVKNWLESGTLHVNKKNISP